ncbi:MAG: Uma2 family endonuclease [Planctomycetes bacterium]|nr:Uma2 family endonuclease [Planctomycetota bacterium]
MEVKIGKRPDRQPQNRKVTVDEFWKLSRNRRCELIRGEIIDMTPVGGEHGSIQINLAIHVGGHIKSQDLGAVSGGETGYKLESDPDTIRAPDLGFVVKARLPEGGVPKKFWPFQPDLAIEIVSPSDSYEDVELKVREWMQAGTREVWVVNPRLKEIKIHRPNQPAKVFRSGEILQSHELLPGLSLKIGDVFNL